MDSEPEIYSCVVCLEHLLDRNPRFLSCHHYFCQACLQMLNKSGEVCCPTCRKKTAVPNNDVTKLDMNFPLVQVMERERHIKVERQQKQGTHMGTGRCCNFCDEGKASFRCTDCNKSLCDGCKKKHSKMKIFENHNIMILQLCQKHIDGISHMCMKCTQGLCVKCIVLDHNKHEYKVKKYAEGVNHLKLDLKKMNKKVKKSRQMVKQYKQENDNERTDIQEEKQKLKRKRKSLMKKIEEIEDNQHYLREREKECDYGVELYTELDKKLYSTCRNIDKLVHLEDDQIVAGFQKQRKSVKSLLSKTENLKL